MEQAALVKAVRWNQIVPRVKYVVAEPVKMAMVALDCRARQITTVHLTSTAAEEYVAMKKTAMISLFGSCLVQFLLVCLSFWSSSCLLSAFVEVEEGTTKEF